MILSFTRLFEYLQENKLDFPVIHHLQYAPGVERFERHSELSFFVIRKGEGWEIWCNA